MQSSFNFVIDKKMDLPSTYNETKIIIIPRDVDVFFMYWEISDITRKDLCDKGIVLDIFIRVRNIGSDKYFYVFHPDPFTKDWYFDISYTELSRNSIISDIGVYDNFGKFLVLASSNVINLPNKFFFGKDYYYWQRRKYKKDSDKKSRVLYSIKNISSKEFCTLNSGTFIKSIKR